MQIMLIFSLIVAIIAVVFAVQNADTANIRFLVWEKDVPIAAALLVAVLLGVLMSMLASSPSMVRRKLTIRNQRKKITELETSLTDQKVKLAEANQKTADLEKQLTENVSEKPAEKLIISSEPQAEAAAE